MLPSLVLKSQGLQMGRGPERERERESWLEFVLGLGLVLLHIERYQGVGLADDVLTT